MFKRSLALVLVIALVITAGLVGCGPKETPAPADQGGDQATPAVEQVLNWNIGSDPKTIDPTLNSAADGGYIINNLYEGLMRQDAEGKMQPATAESYEVSEDGLTYTFKIRENAKWSDGQPVKASDFEYAWKRGLDPATAAEYATILYYIKGGEEFNTGKGTADDVQVKAVDDRTLTVTLVSATPYFPDLTSFYTYMPVRKDMVEKNAEGWATNPETAISNGPFKLAEYAVADKAVMVKNDNYWNAENVKITKINGSMIVEESTTLTAYESDELDVIDSVPQQEIPRLQAEDPTFKILPQLGIYYYIFNVNKEPVNDPKVRKALSMAIDRKAIVENVTQGGQIPGVSAVPFGIPDFDGSDYRKNGGDYLSPDSSQVEEAKKLLAEAGYNVPGLKTDGKPFPKVEVIYNTLEAHKAIAETIQEMWKQNLGIEITLSNQEFAVFQDTRHSGNFTIARAGWLADYADPMTFLDLWMSNNANNDAKWKNAEYDALIKSTMTLKGKERSEAFHKAEDIFMEEMPIMPIYYYTDPVMVKDKVKGWEKTALGHWYFGNASIQ